MWSLALTWYLDLLRDDGSFESVGAGAEEFEEAEGEILRLAMLAQDGYPSSDSRLLAGLSRMDLLGPH